MFRKWRTLFLISFLAAPWAITGCEEDEIGDDAVDALEDTGDELEDIAD